LEFERACYIFIILCVSLDYITTLYLVFFSGVHATEMNSVTAFLINNKIWSDLIGEYFKTISLVVVIFKLVFILFDWIDKNHLPIKKYMPLILLPMLIALPLPAISNLYLLFTGQDSFLLGLLF
jgi:hypothetical protein